MPSIETLRPAVTAVHNLLLRLALASDEHNVGKDHPDVATDLNNLAQLLQAAIGLAEAKPLAPRPRPS